MTMGSKDLGRAPAAAAKRWRAPVPARIASLVPFAVAIVLQLVAPRLSGALLMPPPDLLGVPFPVVVEALTLGWAVLGALVVWTTGSRLAVMLALGFLTIPSMFVLILGPAVILILQNLQDLPG